MVVWFSVFFSPDPIKSYLWLLHCKTKIYILEVRQLIFSAVFQTVKAAEICSAIWQFLRPSILILFKR